VQPFQTLQDDDGSDPLHRSQSLFLEFLELSLFFYPEVFEKVIFDQIELE
jgi:hypothetical protein